jgi:hypothetical protein
MPDASANLFSRRFGGYFDLLFIAIRWADIVPKALNIIQVLADLTLASLSDLKSNSLPLLFIVGSNCIERGRNPYVTLIMSAHPRSLTLCTSPISRCTRRLPLGARLLFLAIRSSHTERQIHIHVKWLQNIGTIYYHLGWGWSSWHLSSTSMFFPFPDVSTDESVGFVAYTMFKRPRYITRRVDTRNQNMVDITYVGYFRAGHCCL